MGHSVFYSFIDVLGSEYGVHYGSYDRSKVERDAARLQYLGPLTEEIHAFPREPVAMQLARLKIDEADDDGICF